MESAPERILAMAKREQAHRHSKENKVIRMKTIDNLLGMAMGISQHIRWTAFQFLNNRRRRRKVRTKFAAHAVQQKEDAV